jgi:hypothetical protein
MIIDEVPISVVMYIGPILKASNLLPPRKHSNDTENKAEQYCRQGSLLRYRNKEKKSKRKRDTEQH